ncbi:TPA: YebC/PmpR family DNA-binding transcriptional regulator [Candidatus Dependentiae bacterium]|nr:MAG: transcriptional regulator [candidate division TM6 bacterium GW2011_GWE2_31_21]KKP53948.1 MAG: transcriptional regulator [candidate division TM6 bacterium GW2011_GWF2_33_332]HBS47728.1 YebC/PmpR family DNA-binding transcriptional regulator [Candidatus Dependentiae bacterium]HBZ73877.1 YebC/PmpR family DNA-binding transcriptional regulator [Candidatus Dependentiae bacterium]
MSGHSKWATIKRKKAALDAKKGKVFTKIIREITVAARDGGGDIAGNAKLRLLIEKAKSENMPIDNITRAIKKGTGELAGENYEPFMYEGYGPAGVAILVETLSDNKNRTVSDLRHLFIKSGGKLGEGGSVSWMFEKKGVIAIKSNGHSEDEVLEKLIDYNIDDISLDEDLFHIYCATEDLEKVKKAAETQNLKVESSEIAWVAKNPLETSAHDEEKVYKLLEELEDLDDVNSVFANLK